MILKICPKCRSKYKYGETCPKGCDKLTRQESVKVYDRYQRKNYNVYHDPKWTRLTEQCKQRFNGIDIYALYKYGKMIPGTLSHHIEPVEDNEARQFDIDNLIYVSAESHAEIHGLYNASNDDKRLIQALLFSYVQKYVKGL